MIKYISYTNRKKKARTMNGKIGQYLIFKFLGLGVERNKTFSCIKTSISAQYLIAK